MSNIAEIERLQIEKADDINRLSAADIEKVQNLAKTINVQNHQEVISFGVEAQNNIAKFADTIINEVRTKDSGYVGDVLANLVSNIKELKVEELSDGKSFWSSIPILGGLVNSAKKFQQRYNKVSAELETLADELDQAKIMLMKEVSLLEKMFYNNLDYYKNLNLYIAAGMLKAKELKEESLPALQNRLDTDNALSQQELNDLNQFLVRLEKRVHDLKLSRMVCLQTAPQLRLIQNNNQVMIEKIQSSLLNTLPLWKNQIVIALSLQKQKKAVDMQRQVTDATNDLLAKNADMLKSSSVAVAREAERSIIDIETLRKTNQSLIETVEEIISIQAEGRKNRVEAEKELVKMERELRQMATKW